MQPRHFSWKRTVSDLKKKGGKKKKREKKKAIHLENLYVNEQLEESRFNIPGIHISEKAIEGFIVQSPLRMKEKKKKDLGAVRVMSVSYRTKQGTQKTDIP